MTDLEKSIERIVERKIDEVLAARSKSPPEEVKVAEFARRRNLSPTSIYRAIHDGRLQAMRYGSAIRIKADAVIVQPAPKDRRTGGQLAVVRGGK